jgi:hypothetical protein
MSNDTILRLAGVPGIVGVKDATGNLDRACDLIARAPKDFALYTGDDMTAVATISLGFHGDISVTANVAPRLMHEMCVAAAAGNIVKAREIHFKLTGLHRDLFCEANPIPVKWAVHQMGLAQRHPPAADHPVRSQSAACACCHAPGWRHCLTERSKYESSAFRHHPLPARHFPGWLRYSSRFSQDRLQICRQGLDAGGATGSFANCT